MGELTFIRPTGGTISSVFGKDRVKTDKVTMKKTPYKHGGVDYATLEGTSVKSSESGKVIYAEPNIPGYGKLIIIDHTPKANKVKGDKRYIYTLYAHLKKISVRNGDYVEKNVTIGEVGHTGHSTSRPGNKPDHLHFEVFDTTIKATVGDIIQLNGSARKSRVDPTGFINRRITVNGTIDDLTDEEADRLIDEKISFELEYRIGEKPRFAVLVDGVVKDYIDEDNLNVDVELEYDDKELEKLMASPMSSPKKSAPLHVDFNIKL